MEPHTRLGWKRSPRSPSPNATTLYRTPLTDKNCILTTFALRTSVVRNLVFC